MSKYRYELRPTTTTTSSGGRCVTYTVNFVVVKVPWWARVRHLIERVTG